MGEQIGVDMPWGEGLNPMERFKLWFQQAQQAQVLDCDAMILATTDGVWPDARTVLLKGMSDTGLIFYTNYHSSKGMQLELCPRASVVFFWSPLGLQVRIQGTVEKVSREKSEAYFHQRPLQSRYSAVISPQSQPISDRSWLDTQVQALQQQCPQGPECPPHWGGYHLCALKMEFWISGQGRLHQRHQYQYDQSRWCYSLLAP